MDYLGDIRLFVEAANLGGLSAAGRKLGLSPAAASARLVKLESVLHTRLFERTTRHLRLTDEGRTYLSYCQQALQALDDGNAFLQAGKSVVGGKMRISATSDFGRNVLKSWLDQFNTQYPEVRFALVLSDSLSNLLQDDIDLAIRFGVPPDSSFVARPLAPNRRVLCASPRYLAKHGAPNIHGIWNVSTALSLTLSPGLQTTGASPEMTKSKVIGSRLQTLARRMMARSLESGRFTVTALQ